MNATHTPIKQKPTTKQQVIVDEFTNLKSLCGESAIAFFKMSLTDTRKAKEYSFSVPVMLKMSVNKF